LRRMVVSSAEQLPPRRVDQHVILMPPKEGGEAVLVANAALDLYAILQTSVRPKQIQ
jgi:hypothetical protein